MRKTGLAVVAMVVGLGLTSWASAQEKPKAEGPRPDGPPPMLRPNVLGKELGLSDAQKQQVEEIVRKARTDAQAASDPQAKRQIWQSAIEQIGRNVLNDEQRAKFRQLRQQQGPGGGPQPFMEAMKQLDLTQEQKVRMQEIMQQARTDAEKATDPQAKRQALEAARKKIRTEVLTDEQRQQLEKIMANLPRPQSQPAGAQHTGPAHEGKRAPGSRPA